jgi:hypothetical protein
LRVHPPATAEDFIQARHSLGRHPTPAPEIEPRLAQSQIQSQVQNAMAAAVLQPRQPPRPMALAMLVISKHVCSAADE